MAIIKKDFANECISGIWKIEEQEDELLKKIFLSDSEQQYLKNIYSQKRRLEFLAVRALLYELNIKESIKYENRIPICENGHISISHSKTLATIIWHPTQKTTIDVEEVTNRIVGIAYRVFSKEELKFANNNPKILTILWNCKECVYKIFRQDQIDFQKQIKIFPFEENENILCEINHKNINKQYHFSYFEILNNILVWGVDN